MSRVVDEIELVQNKPRIVQHLGDFANLFKAFIGCNYLYMSYAFKQSGWALGIAGVIVISILTDHCCHMIVRCKRIIIDRLVSEHTHKFPHSDHDAYQDRIESTMSYTDIGSLVLGRAGLIIVNISLFITQFGYCIAYFIFIGNTMHSMFPFKNQDHIVPHNHSELLLSDDSYYIGNGTDASTPMPIIPLNPAELMSNTSHITNTDTTAPALSLLVLVPFPIFLGFALIRNVRTLAPVSALANISIFIGFLAVTGYILSDFRISERIEAYRIDTFPIFFGQVTSAYEGIGVIIPIEASMKGNRHNFGCCLHGALYSVSVIIAGLGILGYLKYGCDVAQMINKNMPLHEPLALGISATLIIGVLFTFPLQLFPVIEILEGYLFGEGRLCGPPRSEFSVQDESSRLLDKSKEDSFEGSTTVTVSKSVPAWKRNVFRFLLVATAAGFAVLLRLKFAYIGAFTGAVGSTTLAYILPCVFHLKLMRGSLPVYVQVKDVLIITIGIVGGSFSLYGVMKEFIGNNYVYCPVTSVNATTNATLWF